MLDLQRFNRVDPNELNENIHINVMLPTHQNWLLHKYKTVVTNQVVPQTDNNTTFNTCLPIQTYEVHSHTPAYSGTHTHTHTLHTLQYVRERVRDFRF